MSRYNVVIVVVLMLFYILIFVLFYLLLISMVLSPGGGEKMRLVDDAFAKICHAINDPCVQVRVLAATLLGKMPQVGQNFLDQTLDKKLMSDMRVSVCYPRKLKRILFTMDYNVRLF